MAGVQDCSPRLSLPRRDLPPSHSEPPVGPCGGQGDDSILSGSHDRWDLRDQVTIRG